MAEDSSRPVRVYTTHDYVELNLLRQAIEAAGIRCESEGEKLLMRFADPEMHLLVLAHDEQRAREVIRTSRTTIERDE